MHLSTTPNLRDTCELIAGMVEYVSVPLCTLFLIPKHNYTKLADSLVSMWRRGYKGTSYMYNSQNTKYAIFFPFSIFTSHLFSPPSHLHHFSPPPNPTSHLLSLPLHLLPLFLHLLKRRHTCWVSILHSFFRSSIDVSLHLLFTCCSSHPPLPSDAPSCRSVSRPRHEYPGDEATRHCFHVHCFSVTPRVPEGAYFCLQVGTNGVRVGGEAGGKREDRWVDKEEVKRWYIKKGKRRVEKDV